MSRILVTGSRKWGDANTVLRALGAARAAHPDAVLVHGDAEGLDWLAANIWAGRFDYSSIEPHRAEEFPDPLVRNQYMVDLGADVCLAFALKWRSGTGHCARAARRAGIPVVDYGVDTRVEAKP